MSEDERDLFQVFLRKRFSSEPEATAFLGGSAGLDARLSAEEFERVVRIIGYTRPIDRLFSQCSNQGGIVLRDLLTTAGLPAQSPQIASPFAVVSRGVGQESQRPRTADEPEKVGEHSARTADSAVGREVPGENDLVLSRLPVRNDLEESWQSSAAQDRMLPDVLRTLAIERRCRQGDMFDVGRRLRDVQDWLESRCSQVASELAQTIKQTHDVLRVEAAALEDARGRHDRELGNVLALVQFEGAARREAEAQLAQRLVEECRIREESLGKELQFREESIAALSNRLDKALVEERNVREQWQSSIEFRCSALADAFGDLKREQAKRECDIEAGLALRASETARVQEMAQAWNVEQHSLVSDMRLAMKKQEVRIQELDQTQQAARLSGLEHLSGLQEKLKTECSALSAAVGELKSEQARRQREIDADLSLRASETARVQEMAQSWIAQQHSLVSDLTFCSKQQELRIEELEKARAAHLSELERASGLQEQVKADFAEALRGHAAQLSELERKAGLQKKVKADFSEALKAHAAHLSELERKSGLQEKVKADVADLKAQAKKMRDEFTEDLAQALSAEALSCRGFVRIEDLAQATHQAVLERTSGLEEKLKKEFADVLYLELEDLRPARAGDDHIAHEGRKGRSLKDSASDQPSKNMAVPDKAEWEAVEPDKAEWEAVEPDKAVKPDKAEWEVEVSKLAARILPLEDLSLSGVQKLQNVEATVVSDKAAWEAELSKLTARIMSLEDFSSFDAIQNGLMRLQNHEADVLAVGEEMRSMKGELEKLQTLEWHASRLDELDRKYLFQERLFLDMSNSVHHSRDQMNELIWKKERDLKDVEKNPSVNDIVQGLCEQLKGDVLEQLKYEVRGNNVAFQDDTDAQTNKEESDDVNEGMQTVAYQAELNAIKYEMKTMREQVAIIHGCANAQTFKDLLQIERIDLQAELEALDFALKGQGAQLAHVVDQVQHVMDKQGQDVSEKELLLRTLRDLQGELGAFDLVLKGQGAQLAHLVKQVQHKQGQDVSQTELLLRSANPPGPAFEPFGSGIVEPEATLHLGSQVSSAHQSGVASGALASSKLPASVIESFASSDALRQLKIELRGQVLHLQDTQHESENRIYQWMADTRAWLEQQLRDRR